MSNKNQYGNVAGVHTPKTTESILNRLNKDTNLSFDDSSWHNDALDSLFSEKGKVQIYIPNSIKSDQDNGEWGTFSIEVEECQAIEKQTIMEVITFLNELFPA